MKLFVNGTQECSVTNAGAAFTGSANPLHLGRDQGVTNSWAGQVADLRTYNSALTAVNASDNMSATMGRFPNVVKDISGLKLWLKADSIIGSSDGASVASWGDSSGNGINAVQATFSYQPVFKANVLNGKPVVRLDGVDDQLSFTRISDIRTIFIVNKWAAADTFYTPMIGDDLYYDMISAGGDVSTLFDGNYAAAVTSGSAWANGISANPSLLTKNTANFRVLSLVTAINVRASNIASDRSIAARFFRGDIAEIIIYNRVLTTTERQAVEAYLNAKYNLY